MSTTMSSMLALPKVLLLGLRKSGKSSIQKVVFEGMQPHESVNLPTTVQPERSTVRNSEFIDFEVWDFPGQSDPFHEGGVENYNVQQLLDNCGAIVFVLDCRELIDDARARLVDTLCAAYRCNPMLPTEVFIHKVDALSEEQQSDLLASLKRRVEDEVRQRLDTSRLLALNYNLTSIYDHSVFEAFSAVVQNVVKEKTVYMAEILQMFNSNSNMKLSYLFLSKSKLYIAADERNRVKSRTYELCSDAIELMLRIGDLYGNALAKHGSTSTNTQNVRTRQHARLTSNDDKHTANDTRHDDETKHEQAVGDTQKQQSTKTKDTAIIRISNDECIYINKMTRAFTVVSIMHTDNLTNMDMIETNIKTCCHVIQQLFSTS